MFCFLCYSDLDSYSLPHLCSLKELNLVALTAGIILVPGVVITNQNCKWYALSWFGLGGPLKRTTDALFTRLSPFNKAFIFHLSLGMISALPVLDHWVTFS